MDGCMGWALKVMLTRGLRWVRRSFGRGMYALLGR